MALTVHEKTDIINKFADHATDTGSTVVQIAILTHDIAKLNEHINAHKKDVHCRRGLVAKVRKRESLLDYLYRTAPESYLDVVQRLCIRDKRNKQ